MDKSRKLEILRSSVTLAGTLITTGVVVGSLVHDFICKEDKKCVLCRKIEAHKLKKATPVVEAAEEDAEGETDQTDLP